MNSYNRLTILLIVLAILLIPACKRIAEVPGDNEKLLQKYVIYYDHSFTQGVDERFAVPPAEEFLRNQRYYNKIDITDSIHLEKIKSILPQEETILAFIDLVFMVIMEYQNYKDTLFLSGGFPPIDKTGFATTIDGSSYNTESMYFYGYNADSLYKYTYDIVVERDGLWREKYLWWRDEREKYYSDN